MPISPSIFSASNDYLCIRPDCDVVYLTFAPYSPLSFSLKFYSLSFYAYNTITSVIYADTPPTYLPAKPSDYCRYRPKNIFRPALLLNPSVNAFLISRFKFHCLGKTLTLKFIVFVL